MSKDMTFEEKMRVLEELADKMELGTMSLEESMESYEEGMKIIKECEDYIENAKLKIEKISNGEIKEVN